MKSQIQALCDVLVSNDPSLTDLSISLAHFNDDELELVFNATKRNHTLKTLRITAGGDDNGVVVLSVSAALSLASSVVAHPEIRALHFFEMNFTDFGAIALAFHQNENLDRLNIVHCTNLTTSFMENIRYLLSANRLETLNVRNCKCAEGQPLNLSGALRSNQSLKLLFLGNEVANNWLTLSPETIQDIPVLLRGNRDIESLVLSNIDLSSAMVSLIVQAVEGHKSLRGLFFYLMDLDEDCVLAIGNMLQNAPALLEFGLSCPSVGFRHLFSGLGSENSVLETIVLANFDLGVEGARVLGDILKRTQKLKALTLAFNHIENAGACALASALKQNSTLEVLALAINEIGSEGAIALSDALCSNDSLKDINLSGNPIGDDGAASFANMLTVNNSIETVQIGGFEKRGLEALLTCVPHMCRVETLTICLDLNLVTAFADAIVGALEQNFFLKQVRFCDADGESIHNDEISPRVNHFLALNHGGRRILKSPSVPRSLWPNILGRCSNDPNVLFNFLHQKPDVLVPRTRGTQKRKIEDSGV